MQALFKEVHTVIKSMNKYSKMILNFGVPFILAVYLGAAYLYVFAGVGGAYYSMMRLCFELLICGQELLGAIVIPALFLQILYLAEAFDNN